MLYLGTFLLYNRWEISDVMNTWYITINILRLKQQWMS